MADFTIVTWSPKDPVSAAKLQAMMDNDLYLKDKADTNAPKGILAGAKQITPVSFNNVSENDIGGLNIQAVLTESRALRLVFQMRAWSSSENGNILVFRFREVSAGGIGVGGTNIYIPYANTPAPGVYVESLLIRNAGTHQFKVTVQRGVGSGAYSSLSDSGTPGLLYIEDIGPNTTIGQF